MWWNNSAWLDGEPDAKPPNLLETLGTEPELIPEIVPEKEPETTEKTEGKGGFLWLAGGVATLLALAIRGR